MRNISFGMKTLELPSGMRIVVEEDHSQPLVAIVSVVDVGSAKDPEGKEGLAHLVEHLTFRTKPDGKVQRSNLLDFAAAGFWNAFTSHDLTTYVTIGPREALPQLLSLEGNRLRSPLAGLDARAFEVEREVVKNEINQRDEQGDVSAVEARLYGALYPPGHPYHRPVGGTEASIASLTLADAEAFVREHYVPRNITFYVSGDLDPANIEKVFDASFPHEFAEAPASGPVAPAHRLEGVNTPVPRPSPAKFETIRAPAERPTLYIAWALPGGLGAQRYLERFTRTAFSNVSAQAATRGSDIEGLATGLTEGRYGNTLLCRVFLKEGKNPEQSLERVLDQVVKIWIPAQWPDNARSIQRDSQEVDRLQKLAVVGFALQSESVTTRAIDKATIIHWTGDATAWGKDMQGLGEVNPAKVEAFTFEWLARDRARAVFVEPIGSRALEVTGTPDVFAAADDVKVRIAPEALKTYVHGPLSNVRSFVLKNGLEVLLVQRSSAPTVAVNLGVRGGSATSEPLGAPQLASMLASPTQNANGPPAKYGARLALSPSRDATYYAGQAASGNLENLLAMMSDGVKSLHVDGKWSRIWDQLVQNYRRVDGMASSQAGRTFLELSFPGSSLRRVATAADIERLGPGDVQTWIDRAIRPRGAVLAVVGDIDPAEAEKEVRAWFDGWQGEPDPRAEAPPGMLGEDSGPIRVSHIDRPGVKQTDIHLGCSLQTDSPTERIALRLLAGRLRGRLWGLARSSLGGSYGFAESVSFHRQASSLEVEGTVDDRTLTRVLAIARKELDELGTAKLSPDEFALLQWRQGIASNIRFTTNAQLARVLVATRLANVPIDFVSKYPEQLAAVTADDVTRVAAACRKTAVLLLTGDPAVVGKALQATAR